MNVKVCDICFKEGKLSRQAGSCSIKGKPWLKVDYCQACKDKPPKTFKDYEKFVAELRGFAVEGGQA